MNELKLLIEMVAELPQMALWVLVGFFVYKVAVVGSMFGVAKLLIMKFHNWAVTPKHKLIDVRSQVDDIVIGGSFESLMIQLRRLTKGGRFIHQADIDWLKMAIDEKLERDNNNER